MSGYTGVDEVRWTPEQAVAWVLDEVDATDAPWGNYCLKLTSNAYGFEGSGIDDASDYWAGSNHRHSGDTTPPLGAVACWPTGGYGHICVVVDDGDGVAADVLVASNDVKRAGHVDVVPLSWVTKNWGLPYGGWCEPCYWAGWGSNPDGPPDTGGGTAPGPDPITEDDDMPIMLTNPGNHQVALLDGGKMSYLGDPNSVHNLQAAGVKGPVTLASSDWTRATSVYDYNEDETPL